MQGIPLTHEATRLPGVHFGTVQFLKFAHRIRVLAAQVRGSESERPEDGQEVGIAQAAHLSRSFRNVVDLIKLRLMEIDQRMIFSLWKHVVRYLFEYLVLKEL